MKGQDEMVQHKVEQERQHPTPPELRALDRVWHDEAMEYWSQRRDQKILILMDSQARLAFVYDNRYRLMLRGTYETCLLNAYADCSCNWSKWPLDAIMYLFAIADRDKLRDCGDPMPDHETFLLYRGVSGKGRARRVRSLSWTADPSCAAWFAMRFAEFGDPAVFSVRVERKDILCHLGKSYRGEDEYLVLPPDLGKPKRMKVLPDPKAYEDRMRNGDEALVA